MLTESYNLKFIYLCHNIIESHNLHATSAVKQIVIEKRLVVQITLTPVNNAAKFGWVINTRPYHLDVTNTHKYMVVMHSRNNKVHVSYRFFLKLTILH